MSEDLIQNEQKKRKEAMELFARCSPMFLAMGDFARQQLLLDIAAKNDEGVNVADLIEEMNLSRSAVSYHLKILKDAGLISTRKFGTQVRYYIGAEKNVELMGKLVELIEELFVLRGKK